MVEEHFTGDVSAQLVITHPNSVVALSPCGRDITICRQEVQIRDIAWKRNLDYFHCETLCVCAVALIPMENATLTVHFRRIF